MSVVLIALNEERNIARALESVSWADDIVIYDSGSTDATIAIAKKMGARVVGGEWLGFGRTKKLAVANAKYDWILSLDCDEEVTQGLREEIQKKFSKLDSKVAYGLPRLSFFLGRWIRFGGWYPDYQVRLFNRRFANWNEAEVHEKIEAVLYEKFLSHLNHYVFRDIAHQVQTNNRYSSLMAEDLYKRGVEYSAFKFFTKPSVKFLECYVWKLGFLDGWPGYVIARNAAHSVFMKWGKLREREKLK